MAPPCKVVIPKVVSDRSVHTDTISNSVVVTGDGSHVTATFGDTGARLDMWRRQVRAPDRRRPPRPGGPPRELELFRLDFDVLPFQGRRDSLTDLLAWLGTAASLGIPSGTDPRTRGKDRNSATHRAGLDRASRFDNLRQSPQNVMPIFSLPFDRSLAPQHDADLMRIRRFAPAWKGNPSFNPVWKI